MRKQYEVARGESLVSIARDNGLLPGSIWYDPENSTLRKKRQHSDHLLPGDVLSIRDVEPKSESLATDQRHRLILKGDLGIVIRLEIDPAEASSIQDRFVLTSSDGSYKVERTVKDDLVSGDEYVDLFFSGLNQNKNYTLQIFSPSASDPVVAFENVSYAKLANLSPSASEEQDPSLQVEEDSEPEEDEDQAQDEEVENADSGAGESPEDPASEE